MSSSSRSSHSPSGTLASVEEEFLSPHIQPLSPTAHPIDHKLYQELSVIQDDILTVSCLDNSAVLAFGKRWSGSRRWRGVSEISTTIKLDHTNDIAPTTSYRQHCTNNIVLTTSHQ
ncbi:hypothetical protein FRC02_004366 [Tulasnella sp. 418]|nr:hypothetical protein FRC02_004366 [Tulasnella sp. 418]